MRSRSFEDMLKNSRGIGNTLQVCLFGYAGLNELIGFVIIGKLAEEDIGIISPYFAQCSRLKASLGSMGGLKIGSVEEFQGQV